MKRNLTKDHWKCKCGHKNPTREIAIRAYKLGIKKEYCEKCDNYVDVE